MATARALRLLPPVDDDVVEVSRLVLERVVAGAESLSGDIEAALADGRMLVFARNPGAQLNNLNRIGLRMQRFLEDFEPLGAQPTEPRPIRLA